MLFQVVQLLHSNDTHLRNKTILGLLYPSQLLILVGSVLKYFN